MSRFKSISALVALVCLAFASVNASAATYNSAAGGIENFGDYLGTFIGPDSEEWFSDNLDLELTLLETILSPALSSGGLSIINPVLSSGGGLLGGQWVYSGPGIVTHITIGTGNVFAVYEFGDGANTGFFDTSALVNRPTQFLTVYTAAPIPLPAAAWLLLSGIIGLFGFTKRSK